jgi:hypothetical protein
MRGTEGASDWLPTRVLKLILTEIDEFAKAVNPKDKWALLNLNVLIS